MRLERHVGGLGKARQKNYLEARGWGLDDGKWTSPRHEDPVAMSRALHIQLTQDIAGGLAPNGWTIDGYSPRGYARMRDPIDGDTCSLPAALRRQARRERRKVAELTYSLFLAAII